MNNLEESNAYLELLIESIKAVKMPLISYDKNGSAEYVNERAFAYELYRQMANRLYDDVTSRYCERWKEERPPIVINAELYKNVGAGNTEDDKGRKFPDIVIHGGQHNTDKQLLACEIKVKASRKEIQEDLAKLLDYMDKENMFNHPYCKAVFINVGPIDKLYENLQSQNINIKKQGLFIVSYDEGKVHIIDSMEL